MLINQVFMYSSWSKPWGNPMEVVPQRKAKGLLAAKGPGEACRPHSKRPSYMSPFRLPLPGGDGGLQEGAGHCP